jgi:hypothetical protein
MHIKIIGKIYLNKIFFYSLKRPKYAHTTLPAMGATTKINQTMQINDIQTTHHKCTHNPPVDT